MLQGVYKCFTSQFCAGRHVLKAAKVDSPMKRTVTKLYENEVRYRNAGISLGGLWFAYMNRIYCSRGVKSVSIRSHVTINASNGNHLQAIDCARYDRIVREEQEHLLLELEWFGYLRTGVYNTSACGSLPPSASCSTTYNQDNEERQL